MSLIDLHTHSICSDGTDTPENLIKHAHEKKLTAIALTDHDTTEGLLRARQAANDFKMEFVNGVELSVEYNQKELHLLGLFINDMQPDLYNMLEDMRKARKKRNIKMIEQMQKDGLIVTYEELVALSSNADVITRVQFAMLLVKKGYANTKEEAFAIHLSPGSKNYIKRAFFNPREAIENIHKAGGIAILAHPKVYHYTNAQFEDVITALKNLGLDAIEAIYPRNDAREEQYYKQMAKKYELKISGGSDYHGANRPKILLGTGYGNIKVPYTILENLRKE